ncbi:hypothetical protein GEOBRER4_n1029 [Citrifermentans bremense]|uniref:DUF4124 domain-containing protein n=1 Tax=Citrifermentans bremense TaxID=60035 RepID=A0A6S6LXW5_9BACT|nr:DUF4124 domain-containing protein [Citrifermentans bremense]BCG46239.1 hypothetical protein GEOBRER4_n1029 [Citrifermentans bremense]
MRQILIATLLLFVSTPAIASAANYQWRDDQGVTHFTDDPDRIPDKYLERAREIGSVAGEKKESAPAATSGAATAAQAAPGAAPAPKSAEQERANAELNKLREDLAAKKAELARLRRKWKLAKGRNPSAKEIKEFEEKQAAGKATYKDNPYVNISPLSSPIPARIAYFKKLEEVQKDEERIRQLEEQLQAQGR